MTAKELSNKFIEISKGVPSMFDVDKETANAAVMKFQEKYLKEHINEIN